MYIKMDKSNTKNLGTKLKSCGTDLGKDIKEYQAEVDSIPNSWTGGDAAKYMSTINSKFIPALNNLKDAIDSYANYLEKVPNTYDGLDNSFSSRNISV